MLGRTIDSKESSKDVLKRVKCFILDLDGTVYLGDKILEGSINFLEELEKNNIKFKFFTNNSSKNAQVYIKRIKKMGYNLSDDKMLISNNVIINYIKENIPEKKVFVLGTDYLKEDFRAANINVVTEDADVVVVGFDTSLVYENVSKACEFIRNGALFLGVNPDFNCPTEDGFIPDCGSICSMITASTGVVPEYFGKPTHHTLKYVLKDTGFHEEEIAFVGDRLYTDIAIGKDNASVTILVLSGEAKLEDLLKSEIQPSLIFDSLGAVKNVLEEIYS
ncbi:HAD-IIA family hydrolase [Clostridium estertheticum]|uniref:Acid sugar phosphatase n=1 Tax=Clostridium estertheticum subsp. estertheticum TaxID=1552 RepID=A0A1J0GFP3_9CLOT|nr:HAD-IIA family hydrolase [Clostridium estertheticum]APC40123.1 HAD family hydrolase [Clostridium estertheticum subsp. estertheticum]MBU3072362.1 HAD-IIA family hydrolase [Clostridium estertheticum]MBU3162455.1 HAD-IIA family hydrolase [Clostridium estertheticum]MBU3170342.1 HAD-IIA family hydrolase [Clostridium estertheticum]MBZ9618094.1 HAD-IIA family hydrolase [Clostridium estertheticum subsp. laramiense]